MKIAGGILLVLLASSVPGVHADVLPEPGSPEAFRQERQAAKTCEPGEETVLCAPPYVRRGHDSPPNCEKLQSAPVYYPLNRVNNYVFRLCKSPPDLPGKCLSGDRPVLCDPWCAQDECPNSCDAYLHSDKFYRILSKDTLHGDKLPRFLNWGTLQSVNKDKQDRKTLYIYCGPNRARTARIRKETERWGEDKADCRQHSIKVGRAGEECDEGERTVECTTDRRPNDPRSCARLEGSLAYYKRGSQPANADGQLYCELSLEEARSREEGFRRCLERVQAERARP